MKPLERILIGVALATALASAGYFGWRTLSSTRTPRAARAQSDGSIGVQRPQGDSGEPADLGRWDAPAAQTRGREWSYDVFTPPEIFYDSANEKFVVHGITSKSEPPDPSSRGLRLVAIRHTLFPLQLLGYVGDGARLTGTFENTGTHEVFLAAPGREVAGMNLRIETIALERRSPEIFGDSSLVHVVATAQVRDLATGALKTLLSGERCFGEALVAIVAVHEGEEETFLELRVGEEARALEKRYAVERIEMNPSVVRIVATGSAPSSAQRMDLTPNPSSRVE